MGGSASSVAEFTLPLRMTPGRHRVDPYAVASRRQSLGQPDDPGLGSRVGGMSGWLIRNEVDVKLMIDPPPASFMPRDGFARKSAA
jgi:hypothetical protein